jgi:hypothetical protein
MYLPHLALPLAASWMVIPLEQEIKNWQMAIIAMNVRRMLFFIVRVFGV